MKRHYAQRVLTTSTTIQEKYLKIIRSDEKSFSRERKIKLSELFIQMIASKGRSQKNELFEFYNEVNQSMDVSPTAFFNARMKFNPEALLTIMQDITKEEYETPDVLCKYNDYYIFAIDGSDVSLPATDETRSIYGHYTNQYGEKQNTVLSSISTLYDCINELFLDVKIKPYKSSEDISAMEHMAFISNYLAKEEKYLTIFDRGYFGIRLIDQLLEANQFFLIRLPSNNLKKEQSLLTNDNPDQWMDVEYKKERANNYSDDRIFYNKLQNTKYHLRFVKLDYKDTNGEMQSSYFVTNLCSKQFPTESIYNLYHLRWKIETAYRSLKSQIVMENFSGVRDMLIRQDIYASAFIYNNISMTVAESIIENRENNISDCKYPQKVNRNFALGVLKTDLLKMFVLYKNKKAHKQAQKRFEENIIKYSCPIREGRSRPREVVGCVKQKPSYKKSF